MAAAFYDSLADSYDLIFADWKQSIQRQADALDRVIRAELEHASTLLDCTCGIGTQALGLAQRGYTVTGTDLSAAEIARAVREAEALGLDIPFAVVDVRDLDSEVPGSFDVVIACDNSLPHLLTDDDLGRAARAIYRKVRPGGLILASTRDYDRLVVERPRSQLPSIVDGPSGRRIVFQVWDWWQDLRGYTLHLFILQQSASAWTTSHFQSEYRALRRGELTTCLEQAGFAEVRWRFPDETGFFQPIVTARSPASSLRA